MQGIMDHIVLNAEDVEALVRFYTDIVELTPERVDDYRQGKVLFPSVRINENTLIDIAPKAMWERSSLRSVARRNLNHFCLTLDKSEWDKLCARLDAHRVSTDGPHPRWGARGNGTSIYFHDPEGNEIEARYYGE